MVFYFLFVFYLVMYVFILERGLIMILFLGILLIIFMFLLFRTSKKLKKLKNEIIATDNEFIIDIIRTYDEFKSHVLISDTTELRTVLFSYFSKFDAIENEYFYPKIGCDTENEEG